MDNYFEEFYEQIIEWNRLGTEEQEWGTPEFKDLYWGLLSEEFLEMRKGYRENNTIELVDGVADTYFVLCMLVELNSDNLSQETQFATGLTPLHKFIAMAEPIIFEKRDESVFYLMSALCSAMDYSNYPMKDIVKEVIRSNYSKFPKVEEVNSFYGEDSINKACKWIENNRGYASVRAREKSGRLIFRADGGNGKIMKWENFSPANLKQYIDKLNEGDV